MQTLTTFITQDTPSHYTLHNRLGSAVEKVKHGTKDTHGRRLHKYNVPLSSAGLQNVAYQVDANETWNGSGRVHQAWRGVLRVRGQRRYEGQVLEWGLGDRRGVVVRGQKWCGCQQLKEVWGLGMSWARHRKE